MWSEIQMDQLALSEQTAAEMDARARTTYDINHERPWGWKVSAYLWTKSIAAGAFLISAIAVGAGYVRGSWIFELAAPQIALLFLFATVALLIFDLKRPERFLRILMTPQWRSWLVLGGYTLLIFGAFVALWLASQLLGLFFLEGPSMLFGGVFAALAAVYSAFLFRQARGRVFWHSSLVPLHLLVQALAAGSALLLFVAALDAVASGHSPSGEAWTFLYYELMGALVANGVLEMGELLLPEENAERRRAARLVTHGYFSRLFWGVAVTLGVLVPLIALITGAAQSGPIAALIAIFALAGIYTWEHVWVQAGQAVPLS